ncbi:set domain protein [Stylonychia lemnae]|uniref:Set domain protein n=1 Tax=Stylonychia lemnae TaxID=5949 RepID=A0A078A3L7_STYLE|nr:set domain protein [Stylonychia lemnae]|eukprot:CDW76123.1 set domain protein [Stylonychia lemnae]
MADYLCEDILNRLKQENCLCINKNKTRELQQQTLFIKFHKWLKENGAIYDHCIEYPVAFSDKPDNQNFYLIGVAAKKLLGPQQAYLYIPNKLIINEYKLLQSEYGHIFRENEHLFKEGSEGEQIQLIFYVICEQIKGEASFWYPYFQTCQDSDLPQFWKDDELEDLEDQLMIAEIQEVRGNYQKEFQLCRSIASKYPELIDLDKFSEDLYKIAYNLVTTRCFGWSLPYTSLVPLADCFNHYNIDNQYELFNSKLHTLLSDYNPKSSVQELKEELREVDYQYYTKEKMQLNFMKNFKEDQDLDKNQQPAGESSSEGDSDDPDDIPEISQKRVNKLMIRSTCLGLTTQQFLEDEGYQKCQIWDLKYDSTSDEEDNDTSSESSSSETEELEIEDNSQNKKKKRDQYTFTYQDNQVIKKKIDRNSVDNARKLNLIDLLVQQKEYLDAKETKMRKLKQQDDQRYRKFIMQEETSSDEEDDEKFEWYEDQDKNTFFTLCTQYKTAYDKGDQIFHCYGRRTNRFLLLNYGFVLQDNKYNSITLRVNITLNKTKDEILNEQQILADRVSEAVGLNKISKYIKLKKDRISEELLSYLRASLMNVYRDQNHQYLLISTPVEIKFEMQVLLSAINLLQNLLNTRFKKSIYEDRKILQESDLSGRKRTAIIFRLKQKEIFESQIKLYSILTKVLSRLQNGSSFKQTYLQRVEGYETDNQIIYNRLRLRKYLRELIINQKRVLSVPLEPDYVEKFKEYYGGIQQQPSQNEYKENNEVNTTEPRGQQKINE